ncbi:hypothetical protein HWQ46_21760 [Shewanella sp. D64]|uniref:hypothetical protein n=1 Tax=unclassified Shewanella TaxID=196818 RepID=UPI0022BA40EB|nr:MULTISPECIES: hypothetical protein [unclassified Shewanella]MEC4728167.1 hypothetical protein [Shewanella sp. D64]MEC4740287.1 hypothetical protein [Shewanella sp. E94]WBJ94398.1 hypothetical protein HWQ47_21395 [Shewanella sp. MTB7]
MDTSDLIIDRNDDDFANAVRQLLPKGQYWQDSTNTELNNLIAGMGADFKVTHDEVQLALLAEVDNELFGWRLADYQHLMTETGARGNVVDDPAFPNLITVNVDASWPYDKVMPAFIEVRLPHTDFHWILDATASKAPLKVYVGAYKTVVHEVTIGPKSKSSKVYGAVYAAPYVTIFEDVEIRLT